MNKLCIPALITAVALGASASVYADTVYRSSRNYSNYGILGAPVAVVDAATGATVDTVRVVGGATRTAVGLPAAAVHRATNPHRYHKVKYVKTYPRHHDHRTVVIYD